MLIPLIYRHHLFTHKRQSDRMHVFHHDHGKEHRSTAAKINVKNPVTNAPPIASVSNAYKRDESLTENLRQQLLHRFKLFAIKMKNENMSSDGGDFYEQCFNFMGNLILSNIQGVSKEMFSSTNKTVPPTKITPLPVPPLTIKREDGNTFVKKFTCNCCNATFPSIRHLERHSVQHTGAKPHICEVSRNQNCVKCILEN